MTKDEILEITKNADANHGGDLGLAALDFLGLSDSDASGRDAHAAAVGGIVDEVRQWNEATPETRKEIEAYKSAKEPKKRTRQQAPKTTGKTKAKSK